MNAVIYIHGKGGSAAECEHYKSLFPDCEVIGLDYQTFSEGGAQEIYQDVKANGDFLGFARQYAFSEETE